MRTLLFILVGVVFATLAARLAPATRRTQAVLLFTLGWLAVSAWNLRTGLSHGYTLAEELPIHLVLFGIPAAVAWAWWWRARR